MGKRKEKKFGGREPKGRRLKTKVWGRPIHFETPNGTEEWRYSIVSYYDRIKFMNPDGHVTTVPMYLFLGRTKEDFREEKYSYWEHGGPHGPVTPAQVKKYIDLNRAKLDVCVV